MCTCDSIIPRVCICCMHIYACLHVCLIATTCMPDHIARKNLSLLSCLPREPEFLQHYLISIESMFVKLLSI